MLEVEVLVAADERSVREILRRRIHLVGTELDPDAFVNELLGVQAGMLDANDRREQPQLDVAAHHFEIPPLTLEPLRFGGLVREFFDFRPDTARCRAVREECDGGDSATAGLQSRQERLQANAQWADNAQAGDDYSGIGRIAHAELLTSFGRRGVIAEAAGGVRKTNPRLFARFGFSQ